MKRIWLGILWLAYVMFLGVFSLDTPIWSWGFLIHLIPCLVVMIAGIVAQRYPKIGLILFLFLFGLFTFYFQTYRNGINFLLISGPLLVIAIGLTGHKKWLVLLLGLVILVIGFNYWKSRNTQNIKKNVFSGKWVEYKAKCPTLAAIKIYYPEEWKPGIAEEKITNGMSEEQSKSQCLMEFGYPEAPQGQQDPWTPGMVGIFSVSGQSLPLDSSIKTVEDYVKAEMAGGDVVLTEKQEVNGMEWTMVNRAGGYYEWITSNKGKMYEVRFRDKRTEDEVGVDMVNYVRKTVTEAAKRIQFN